LWIGDDGRAVPDPAIVANPQGKLKALL